MRRPVVSIERSEYGAIQAMREAYRAEANCQIIRDSILRRSLADPYWIRIDGQIAGYAGIWNKYDPGRLMEVYVRPEDRRHGVYIFEAIVQQARPTEIEAQTNIPLGLTMLYDWAENIRSENVLFGDGLTTELACPGAIFRASRPEDKTDDAFVLESGGAVVASGGFLEHYNPPYADIYMEVREAEREKGYGAFLVQELKRACRAAGKIPAARCNEDNVISRKTLAKAGMIPVGRMLAGRVRPS